MNQHAVYQQLRSHLADLLLRAADEALPAELKRASSDRFSVEFVTSDTKGVPVPASTQPASKT